MNNYVLFAVPLISAFLGWISHRLAVRFLLHSFLPKKKAQLARSLGQYVAAELIQIDKIAGQLRDPAALEALKPAIAAHVESFLQVRLKEKIPVLSMFLSDSMLETIKEGLLEEIDALLPQIIGQYLDGLGEKLDIGRMVEQKITALPDSIIEQKLKSGLKKEFRYVELFGAVVGFVIGLIQVAVILLLN